MVVVGACWPRFGIVEGEALPGVDYRDAARSFLLPERDPRMRLRYWTATETGICCLTRVFDSK